MISEIEDIQRQGQQVGRNGVDRHVSLRPAPEPAKFVTQGVVSPSVPNSLEHDSEPVVELDPFEALDPVVELSTAPVKEKAPEPKPVAGSGSSRVSMQLSREVVLSLQMENSDECVELRQNENSIEIRFSDGKAVHLPLKSVA